MATTIIKISELLTHTANARSAWTRGCTLYALDLLDNIKERTAYEGRPPPERSRRAACVGT